jgi:diacylglycerol kinase family enzyme
MNARWLARSAFALMLAAVAVLIGGAGLRSLGMVGIGVIAACLILAGEYWFLAHRGVLRWLALGLVVFTPIAVLVVFALNNQIWVAVVSVTLMLLAAGAARRALAPPPDATSMPAREVPPPKRAFLIMNPKSGGGKVAKFNLKEKAETLGAQVALLEGPGEVDVAALARQAVADGADLLGVAGGDGTQALVAGIAAEHDLPFLVISAGTRNHFAMDLGLDRDDPSTCLAALTEGVEQQIDLGIIGDRTFVNNASFGAYAEIVKNPAYRDDKRGTTLQILPDLLSGHRGAKLTAHAGDTTVTGPQAVLVSNDPYEISDIAGLGRRPRLDAGTLGFIAVTVNNALQAVTLLRGAQGQGLTVLTPGEVVVDANTTEIPVGIDGETVMMPAPVRCTIRPKVLRVRVPRHRPGVLAAAAEPRLNWSVLRKLAFSRSDERGAVWLAQQEKVHARVLKPRSIIGG